MTDVEPQAPVPDDDKKKRKKAEKARGAWITFAGRVVAQVVGAVASVVLGVMVLQRYQNPPAAPATTAADVTAAPRAGAARRPGDVAIAVLPLDNLSGDEKQEYFVDGMTEAVIAGLARTEGLRVISRTSTTRYKTEHPTIPEIAQALGADLVVEGSVLQADGRVRITAQLIDGGTDEHLWAQSYTRPLKDVIALQDEVATAIATEIKGTVTQRPGSRPATEHAVDAATYDLYLRGRHAWFERTPESMRTALEFFEKAAAQDPMFALAYVGIANAYVLQGSPGMPLDANRERLDKARSAAIHALDLDGTLAEAHTALGGLIFFGERDLEGAEPKFRKAIELNPNYSVAHEWLGLLLSELGRTDEALDQVAKAIALDPLEATMHQARGMIQYNAGRYAAAVTTLRRSLELSPSLPLAQVLLAKALVMQGQFADALAPCATLVDGPETIDLRIVCTVAAAKAGRADQARALRAPLEQRADRLGAALAQIDAATGQTTAAWPRLDGLAKRGALPPVFLNDPLFAGLRREARWAGVLAQHQANAPRPAAPPPAGSRPGPPPPGPRPSAPPISR